MSQKAPSKINQHNSQFWHHKTTSGHLSKNSHCIIQAPKKSRYRRSRISKSLQSNWRSRIRHTRTLSSSSSLIDDFENSHFVHGVNCAKKIEAFRLNEEFWHRHLRLLYNESFLWKNATNYWRCQLRGLQKSDFDPVIRIADGVFAAKPKLKASRKIYAVKIISNVCDQFEEIVKEFDIMMKLSRSQYFPSVHGFFFDNICYQSCFIMEFLEGFCLMKLTYDILHPPKEPPHPNFNIIAQFYTVELIRAVAFLHKKISVPHGDLKNDNVMITLNGHLKIIDFDYCGQSSVYHFSERFNRFNHRSSHSVSKYFKKEIRSLHGGIDPNFERSEQCFRVMNMTRLRDHESRLHVRSYSGHRAYRSPEYTSMQKKGQLIHPKRAIMNDWWAVGVLVYELYMGLHPFAHRDPDSTYPRFRTMDCDDVINFKKYLPLTHSFIADRIGDSKVATFIRCLLTDDFNRLGTKPFASDIKEKGIECGLWYFNEDDPEPPFRPDTWTVEELASTDRHARTNAMKHYRTISKENKNFVKKFPFYSYSSL